MPIYNYITSFLDQIKNLYNSVDIEQWSKQFGGSSAEAAQAVIYFGLSLSAGFLFKKFFKLIVSTIILGFFILILMEYAQLVSIDWTACEKLFGFPSESSFNSIIVHFFEWIRQHILLSVSSLVGFILGYRLG